MQLKKRHRKLVNLALHRLSLYLKITENITNLHESYRDTNIDIGNAYPLVCFDISIRELKEKEYMMLGGDLSVSEK